MNRRDLVRVRMTISAAAQIGRAHRTFIQRSLANPPKKATLAAYRIHCISRTNSLRCMNLLLALSHRTVLAKGVSVCEA